MEENKEIHCYCGNLDVSSLEGTFRCCVCKKRFHAECLKNPVVSLLVADAFYDFTCINCAADGEEEYCRAKMSWLEVVTLALYNLQVKGNSKRGFFHWKQHICAFIDMHWTLFFGPFKKQRATWKGTVAGTISGGSPQHFVSGTAELGEAGWWKLTCMKPPIFLGEPPVKQSRRRPNQDDKGNPFVDAALEEMCSERLSRRSKTFSLSAAIELKAKKSAVDYTPTRKKNPLVVSSASPSRESDNTQTDQVPNFPCGDMQLQEMVSTALDSAGNNNPSTYFCDKDVDGKAILPVDNSQVTQSDFHSTADSYMNSLLDPDIDFEGLDFSESAFSAIAAELDFGSYKSPDLMDVLNLPGVNVDAALSKLPSQGGSQWSDHSNQSMSDSYFQDTGMDTDGSSNVEGGNITGMDEDEQDDDREDAVDEEEDRASTPTQFSASPRQDQFEWKKVKKIKREREEQQEQQEETERKEENKKKLRLMTPYDEERMLKKLKGIMSVQPVASDGSALPPLEAERLCQERNMLHAKLCVRKRKRERGIPVFDIDSVMKRIAEKYHGYKPVEEEKEDKEKRVNKTMGHPHHFGNRTLDMFMRKNDGGRSMTVQHPSFLTRLIGFEDHQLRPFISPYTKRVLKPFIFQNNETVPLRVKLMQEIIAYPHRNDPTWVAPPHASLDFCYVRPELIPSINALCHTFFWPGIDLAECLQYPDFSCVCLYRKLVVGFAFLVPDVKHNEAYISFIFTHPQWRKAGIATFMLYHLCQTCHGKDITLHVSASNTAMLLYQKFGFKSEELCQNFYDKYFPVDSKECRHAFFMRLR